MIDYSNPELSIDIKLSKTVTGNPENRGSRLAREVAIKVFAGNTYLEHKINVQGQSTRDIDLEARRASLEWLGPLLDRQNSSHYFWITSVVLTGTAETGLSGTVKISSSYRDVEHPVIEVEGVQTIDEAEQLAWERLWTFLAGAERKIKGRSAR